MSRALSVSASVSVKCQTQSHPTLLSVDSSSGLKGSQSVFLIEVFHVSFASVIEGFLLCLSRLIVYFILIFFGKMFLFVEKF